MEHVCYIIGAWHGEEAVICPRPGDLVIAADGGYQALQNLGIKADLVVGDFDSLGFIPQKETIIRHPVMKDDTDTMLAVRLGLERSYRNFVITGAIGGRLDHTLANVQTLLFLAEHGATGILYGDGTVATTVQNGSVTLSGTGIVSVFCFGPPATGVYERGMLYSLTDATVTSSFPIGVSNEFTSEPAHISVKDGTLVIFWSAEKDTLPNIIQTRFLP